MSRSESLLTTAKKEYNITDNADVSGNANDDITSQHLFDISIRIDEHDSQAREIAS
jgi:hypothetical protein